MEIRVRNAQLTDIDGIYQAHISSIKKLGARFYTDQEVDIWLSFISPEKYRPIFGIDQFFVVTAEIGEKIVGWGLLTVADGEIRALYVDADYAGKGVGTVLYQSLENEAIKRGNMHLTLNSTLSAVGFYEKMGFTRLGADRFYFTDNFSLQIEKMEKSLAE